MFCPAVQLSSMAGLLVWTQLTRPDASAGDAMVSLEGVTMSELMLTKRMGNADVVLLEFSDFQCTFCAEQLFDTFPDIRRELIDTGILSYGYLHFPLERIHPQARAAGTAAECAGRQGQFWEMHDLLFANQERLSAAEFAAHSDAIGLDPMLFGECMQSDAEALVEADLQQGLALGVIGTPTFFIGTVGADGVVQLTTRFRGQITLEGIKEAITTDDGGWLSWLPWLG